MKGKKTEAKGVLACATPEMRAQLRQQFDLLREHLRQADHYAGLADRRTSTIGCAVMLGAAAGAARSVAKLLETEARRVRGGAA